MLLLHETHEVRGRCEDEFEACVREQWMPRLAKGGDARLLYFLHHAHGTGVSYNAVTLTALRDGAAWERLVRSVDAGELREPAVQLDRLRHDVHGKILIALPWSPLREIDLASVPCDGRVHELSLFMEDTVWPYEDRLEDYVERSGSHYAREMERRGESAILAIQSAWRTAYGSHQRREIVLWQKVVRPRALEPLVSREVPAEHKRPGSWMHDALALRDRWQSRLLRTAAWSPWY
jgi:hypothetical protein